MCEADGVVIENIDYGEKVRAVILTEDEDALVRKITDVTSGRCVIDKPEPAVYAVVDDNVMRF